MSHLSYIITAGLRVIVAITRRYGMWNRAKTARKRVKYRRKRAVIREIPRTLPPGKGRVSPSCTNVFSLWSSSIVWIKTTVTTETEHISVWRLCSMLCASALQKDKNLCSVHTFMIISFCDLVQKSLLWFLCRVRLILSKFFGFSKPQKMIQCMPQKCPTVQLSVSQSLSLFSWFWSVLLYWQQLPAALCQEHQRHC